MGVVKRRLPSPTNQTLNFHNHAPSGWSLAKARVRRLPRCRCSLTLFPHHPSFSSKSPTQYKTRRFPRDELTTKHTTSNHRSTERKSSFWFQLPPSRRRSKTNYENDRHQQTTTILLAIQQQTASFETITCQSEVCTWRWLQLQRGDLPKVFRILQCITQLQRVDLPKVWEIRAT